MVSYIVVSIGYRSSDCRDLVSGGLPRLLKHLVSSGFLVSEMLHVDWLYNNVPALWSDDRIIADSRCSPSAL